MKWKNKSAEMLGGDNIRLFAPVDGSHVADAHDTEQGVNQGADAVKNNRFALLSEVDQDVQQIASGYKINPIQFADINLHSLVAIGKLHQLL